MMDIDYDRTWRNEDGTISYGKDLGDGRTIWYTQDGEPDAMTDTPDEDEQAQNDEGY